MEYVKGEFFARYLLYVLLQSAQWELTEHLEHYFFWRYRHFFDPT